MKVLLIASMCIVLAFGGCVWTADSVPITPEPTALPYQVHLISKRLIDGTEQRATIIAPLPLEYPYEYNYPYYYDSVRYIIVNGDTAYRHPVAIFPAQYDSAAPFHFDGTANVVTFIYGSTSVTDTSNESFTPGSITWPTAGTTISRDTNLTVNFREPSDNFVSITGRVEITDSITNDIEYASVDVGSVEFEADQMMRFGGNIIWVILHENVQEVQGQSYPNYQSIDHSITFDRLVAYSLK
jgi:hypothetical protein